MSDKLQGAYVQAWVWVSAEEFTTHPYEDLTNARLEDAAYAAAKESYERKGEIEFDDDANVLLWCEE